MNGKTVNVVTYCASNSLGSILQAFALKKELLDLNYESVVLLPKSYFVLGNVSFKRRVKQCTLSFLTRNRVSKGKNKCEDFIKESIDVKIYDDISQNNSDIDGPDQLFLAGSDQIWNPDYCFPFYFLDFVKKGRRISYAASMGVTEIQDKNQDKFSELINRFDVLSVREEACKTLISSFTEKSIEVHIDPTLLLTKEEWRQYEQPYEIKEKYILLYMIYWDDSLASKIGALKRRTQLKTYAICNNFSKVKADKRLFDVGPKEFIWLIDHAEYIITSSFHGVALSVNFNKQFAPIVNPESPSRINHLLNLLSVPVVEIDALESKRIDYEATNKMMENERIRSTSYLMRNLRDEFNS